MRPAPLQTQPPPPASAADRARHFPRTGLNYGDANLGPESSEGEVSDAEMWWGAGLPEQQAGRPEQGAGTESAAGPATPPAQGGANAPPPT